MERSQLTGHEDRVTRFTEQISAYRSQPCIPEKKHARVLDRFPQPEWSIDRSHAFDDQRVTLEKPNFVKRPKRMRLIDEAQFCQFFTPRSGLGKKLTRVPVLQSEVHQTCSALKEERKSPTLTFWEGNVTFPPKAIFSCLCQSDSKASSAQSVTFRVKETQARNANIFLANHLGSLAEALAGAATVVDKVKDSEEESEKQHNQVNLDEDRKEKRKIEDDFDNEGSADKSRGDNYWERRRRNNASAKKSRDARRARELQTQIKAAFLEDENLRMRAELMAIQEENIRLKRVLCAKM